MCNCFAENLEKVKKIVVERVTGDAKVLPEDFDIRWDNYVYFLNGKSRVPVSPKVRWEYRKAKKGGGLTKNITKDDASVYARFCPYCGEDSQANLVWNNVANKLPELKEDSDSRRVWAEWDDGEIEVAHYIKYPARSCFQRKCGTDEGGVGYGDKPIGKVVRWCPMQVPPKFVEEVKD